MLSLKNPLSDTEHAAECHPDLFMKQVGQRSGGADSEYNSSF